METIILLVSTMVYGIAGYVIAKINKEDTK